MRLDEIETQVEANQTTLGEHEQQLAELSKTTREALERAIAAGELTEGRFLYETVLTDEDGVRFGFDEADLSEEARSAVISYGESEPIAWAPAGLATPDRHSATSAMLRSARVLRISPSSMGSLMSIGARAAGSPSSIHAVGAAAHKAVNPPRSLRQPRARSCAATTGPYRSATVTTVFLLE